MKNSIRAIIAAAIFSVSSLAMANQELIDLVLENINAIELVGSAADIDVNVDEAGVATIAGNVDVNDKEKIVQAVTGTEGVTEVVDLMEVTE